MVTMSGILLYLSLGKAKDFLDGKLNLKTLSPFNYRKGISYFLRKQKDYADVFQVEKFSHGKHIEWKPYIGKILGFSHDIIEGKYKDDSDIESKEKELTVLKNQLISPDESLDKIRARMEAEDSRIQMLESKLDSFDFKEKDLHISEEELQETEEQIADINNEIYNFNHDLNEIAKSLNTKILFKIENVKRIFEEVQIHFPQSLLKEYKDLEKFNSPSD